MSDEIQKQTTEGITFRIPSGSIHQLRSESAKKQVSLNTLVNQILKDIHMLLKPECFMFQGLPLVGL